MIHQYNMIGCWLVTFLLVTLKATGGDTLSLSWTQTFYPVLALNAFFLLVAIYKRVAILIFGGGES